MVCLIVAGEAIFSLPFHITRYFQPTFLKVFDFTNTELGDSKAIYGVLAMLAYFPGGMVADRFSARKLMFTSLLTTAAGGLYMATIPGTTGMACLWAYWGVTSVLLFWAALIRATRDWGGASGQGRAFGILEGGRGIFALILAEAFVQLFASLMPEDPTAATDQKRTEALQLIIYAYTVFTLIAAFLVWFGIPDTESRSSSTQTRPPLWNNLTKVLSRPTIWLHAIIIVTAYIAYKATDYYSLFAVDAYGMNEVEGAQMSKISAYVRPFAAIAAGLLADRLCSSKVVAGSFTIMGAVFAYMGFSTPDPTASWILLVEIIVACVAVFGVRGVYFALFEEAALPVSITGTAVGIVSVIGYTPDIFVGPIAGRFLDTYPGVKGHQYFLLTVAGACLIGLLTSFLFQFLTRREPSPQKKSA